MQTSALKTTAVTNHGHRAEQQELKSPSRSTRTGQDSTKPLWPALPVLALTSQSSTVHFQISGSYDIDAAQINICDSSAANHHLHLHLPPDKCKLNSHRCLHNVKKNKSVLSGIQRASSQTLQTRGVITVTLHFYDLIDIQSTEFGGICGDHNTERLPIPFGATIQSTT